MLISFKIGDVIGEVFFPPQEGHAAIVESFAVFGGAFLMRPSKYIRSNGVYCIV